MASTSSPGSAAKWASFSSATWGTAGAKIRRIRQRMVSFARRRLKAQLQERGASSQEIEMADEVLDPNALTIGFARRFATYKRATLLLRDPERLKRVITDKTRPVPFLFA